MKKRHCYKTKSAVSRALVQMEERSDERQISRRFALPGGNGFCGSISDLEQLVEVTSSSDPIALSVDWMLPQDSVNPFTIEKVRDGSILILDQKLPQICGVMRKHELEQLPDLVIAQSSEVEIVDNTCNFLHWIYAIVVHRNLHFQRCGGIYHKGPICDSRPC